MIHKSPSNARVLWSMRRSRTDAQCILHGGGPPVEIQVLHDRDVVVTERFPDESFALKWARAYAERLRDQGWFDTPVSQTRAS